MSTKENLITNLIVKDKTYNEELKNTILYNSKYLQMNLKESPNKLSSNPLVNQPPLKQ